jgi:hypothetical protein
MDRYFFKVIDNIDFVWKIEKNVADPYKGDDVSFGLFVCNEHQFVPYLFRTIHDIQSRGLLNDYQEIIPSILTDEKYFYDKTIGLLHKDNYWNTLFAVRYIPCLGTTAQIIFGHKIEPIDSAIYQKLIKCNATVGQIIYNTAYTYFKGLWEIDDYFSSSNLDTMDKFLPTIQLQAIYIGRDNDINENHVLFSFRPSWDEEHGLRITLNLDTKEVQLME